MDNDKAPPHGSSDVPPGISDDLLDRHLAGESNQSESALVTGSFHGADPKQALRDALHAADQPERWDSARAWQSLHRSMHAPAPLHHRSRWQTTTVRIAATILLLVGGATIVRRTVGRNVVDAPSVATLQATTGLGERRDVTLSDGTRVTLAPRSSITYPARFAGSSRDVTLNGHAFFAVAQDSARPFSVKVRGATVRVLGTEFDVREDSAAGEVRVVVQSGRVQLQASPRSAGRVLTARQVGRLVAGTGAVQVDSNAALDVLLGWREGRLAFERRALRDVVRELTLWYDVEFQVDPALARRTVSADLRVGEGSSLDRVLEALTLPLDARFTRTGRIVSVVPR